MATFKLRGKWAQLRSSWDPSKFRSRERRFVQVATEQNGLFVAGQIKRAIRSGGWEANAALTSLIKGSSKPLYDTGQLFQSITSRAVDWQTAFVGVSKQARTKDGKTSLVDVVAVLHEGKSITVSPRMQAMFWYLWLATTGRMKEGKLRGAAREIFERVKNRYVIKPLNPGTTAIRIPSRPFLRKVFRDPQVKRLIKANWEGAVSRALKA